MAVLGALVPEALALGAPSADDSAGTARKKVTGPDGQVLSYMDMTLKGVTPKTFEILRMGLMRK